MNLEELWIGDLLQIVSTGKVGKYEGTSDKGLALLRHGQQLFSAEANDLRPFTPPEVQETIIIEETEESNPRHIHNEIDLHIEILRPSLLNALPERILNYQINAFEEYLAALKSSVVNEATIIHGKGKGVLKAEILSIIKHDKAIFSYDEVHDGGATRIFLGSRR